MEWWVLIYPEIEVLWECLGGAPVPGSRGYWRVPKGNSGLAETWSAIKEFSRYGRGGGEEEAEKHSRQRD